MKQLMDILSDVPLFNGLPEDQLAAVSRITVQRAYTKGEIIFLDGDKGNGFYVVEEGRVRIFKTSSEGKEQILHIFGPGEPFGEAPVFSGKFFPANAQAMTESRVLFFPRKDFVDLITNTPSLAMNMLAMLSMRLRHFTMQVENLSLKEVPERLAVYLLYLAGEQESSGAVTLPISKGQLASLLGTIPETLSRIFSKMSAEGLIRVEGKTIFLLDVERLESLAGQEQENF